MLTLGYPTTRASIGAPCAPPTANATPAHSPARLGRSQLRARWHMVGWQLAHNALYTQTDALFTCFQL